VSGVLRADHRGPRLGDEMASIQAAEKAKRDEAEKAAIAAELVSLREGLANIRQPSKAGAIGTGKSGTSGDEAGFFLWLQRQSDGHGTVSFH